MSDLALDRVPPIQRSLLRAVLDAARPDTPIVLVGGVVRDICAGRILPRSDEAATEPSPVRGIDIDLAVPHGALELARTIANRVHGAFVVLDGERGAARVVTTDARIDVADYRAATLDDDLLARDFTVNALAVSVPELLARGRAPIVDPASGLTDIARRRLEPPSAHVLADDPVRAVRGVRLEAVLGFRLTPRAERMIRSVAADVGRVSAERVRDELVVMLKLERTERPLRRLDALGLLDVIFPETAAMRATEQPAPHRFTVLEHSLRAVRAADGLRARLDAFGPLAAELGAHLAEPVAGGLDRGDLLKLAALLHDVSKPETHREIDGRIRFFEHDVIGAGRTRAIAERLRFPARATDILERLVRHHLRTMHLEQAGQVTRRARYRFFRDLGDDARDLLMLSLVDAAAVRGESPFRVWRRSRLIRDLILGSADAETVAATPPLVRGDDVMARFHVGPGPEVGRLLRIAREAQDLGLVGTRDEALAFLDSRRGDRLE